VSDPVPTKPRRRRTVGLDLGRSRCGVAIDDELGSMAHARPNLEARDVGKLVKALVALAEAENIGRFVVGLPLHMDGREGDGAVRARAFAEKLAQMSGCDVLLWDERLSTVEAARALTASGHQTRDTKGMIDGASASVLLQAWLDRRRLQRERRRRGEGAG
jgi:putative Holliday junction resolvase